MLASPPSSKTAAPVTLSLWRSRARQAKDSQSAVGSTVEAETGAEAPPSERDALPRRLHCPRQISRKRGPRSGAGRMWEGRICEDKLRERTQDSNWRPTRQSSKSLAVSSDRLKRIPLRAQDRETSVINSEIKTAYSIIITRMIHIEQLLPGAQWPSRVGAPPSADLVDLGGVTGLGLRGCVRGGRRLDAIRRRNALMPRSPTRGPAG